MAFPYVPHVWVPGNVLSVARMNNLEAQFQSIIDLLTTRGDIIYRGAATWERLPKGAVLGQFLRQGANDPAWSSVITLAETEVFNGTSPNPSAWTDLDLSAVVGVNTAFVILRFYNANAAARYTGFRMNGETEVSIFDQGPFSTEQIGGTSFGYGLCLTDTSGVIEWYYTEANQANVTIDVIAHI